MVNTSKRKTAEDLQALFQRSIQKAESTRLAKRQQQHQPITRLKSNKYCVFCIVYGASRS